MGRLETCLSDVVFGIEIELGDMQRSITGLDYPWNMFRLTI